MIVVDTSVAVKWFVPEAGTASALTLLGQVLVAPALLQAELGNVLARKARRREIVVDQARSSFAGLTDLLSLLPMQPYAEDAFKMAVDLAHEIYDCYFLAVARSRASLLVTADVKFLNKVRASRYRPLIAGLGEALPHG